LSKDWREALAAGRVEEALALASLSGEGPRQALEALEGVLLSVRLRRYQDALQTLEKRAALLQQVVDVAALRKDLEQLQQERFEDLLEHPLLSAEAWLQKGILAVAQGDLREARDDFAEAARRDPRHWRAWTNLGNAELELGNLEAAEAAYQEAAKRNENYPEAFQGMAALAKRRGDIGRMVALLKKAQKLRMRPREEQLPGAVLPAKKPAFGGFFGWRNRWLIWIALIILAYWFMHR